MITIPHETHARRSRLALLLAASLCAAALPSIAAEPPKSASLEPAMAPVEPTVPTDPTAPATPADLPPAPSQNVTINLINRLVQRHVLSKEDAADLIKQAEEDAVTARAQAPAIPPAGDDTVRVAYIPETVKSQLRDEIRQEVMQQARDENWAAPRTLPPWITRIKLFGDIRIRSQNEFYPSGNVTGLGSNFWNYNSLNTASAPYDITSTALPPFNNVNADRYLLRLRARFGAEADLGDGFSTGFRIGTGDSNMPVSQNQTLGASGGDFSKYAIWLDRGFVRYDLGEDPGRRLTTWLGRFDNPFMSTTIIWWDDIAFDGLAFKGTYRVADGVTPFLTGGIFPVYDTDLNFALNSPSKFPSHDKWLEAVQGGLEWKINADFSAKVAAAYYYFCSVNGQVSTPFVPITNTDAGNTDITRPSFAQKGNTYIALRDITPDVSNNYGTTNQWQYYGLASHFHELSVTGKVDYNHFDPFHVWLNGEYVQNLAFDRNAILDDGPSNLRGPVNNLGSGDVFNGGNAAWIATLNVGNIALEKRWDWVIFAGYRYVESDAVIDGFCEPDFGGGGTNLKGFTIGGSLAFSPRTYLGVRWMSADGIAGPNFREDVLQVDFNAKF